LFQFPSFCRMMMVDRKSHLLSRLLNDYAETQSEDVNVADIPTDEFFEEILRSYRLIFGQDEPSYRHFSKMLNAEQESCGPVRANWAFDPLLQVLCGQSSTSTQARKLYDEIDLNQTGSHVNLKDFPFFGKKLDDLAQFDRNYHPQTVNALLNDKRDLPSYFNNRSTQLLVAFAILTIFLMLVSLIFQIWQVILARQQLEQGSATNIRK